MLADVSQATAAPEKQGYAVLKLLTCVVGIKRCLGNPQSTEEATECYRLETKILQDSFFG